MPLWKIMITYEAQAPTATEALNAWRGGPLLVRLTDEEATFLLSDQDAEVLHRRRLALRQTAMPEVLDGIRGVYQLLEQNDYAEARHQAEVLLRRIEP